MADYEQALTSTIRQLQYEHADLVKSDVLNALRVFVDLEHSQEMYVYEDGYQKNLLKLKGTLPVHFTGSDYNVPISIWLSKRHPFKPPIVYVTPSSRMHVMSGNFVDMNGKVNIPYLIDWTYPGSDLLTLIEIMTTVFSEELPVRGKSISKSDVISGAALQGRSNPGASSDNTASFELSDEVHGRRTINRRHFELSDEVHGKRSSHDPN